MTLVSATQRYRRFEAALGGLAEVSAQPDGAPVAAALAGDDLVLARMKLAAAVLQEAGLTVRFDGGPEELAGYAAEWQRYAAGPVSDLQAQCARDLCRGLLRLWARRGDQSRSRLRTARVRLAGQVRLRCAALRTELEHDRAPDAGAAARRALTLLDDAMTAELAAAGVPWVAPNVLPPELPSLRPPRLENRLTLLFGGGFGVGVALTAGRVGVEVFPAGAGPVAALSTAAGAALAAWVIRTRRQLATRAARQRWAAEVSALVRASAEQHIVTELLAADLAGSRLTL